MKKILAIIFSSLFVLSIMASVSEDIQNKVKVMTGGNEYSASMVPVPKTLVDQDNLASTKENSDTKLKN